MVLSVKLNELPLGLLQTYRILLSLKPLDRGPKIGFSALAIAQPLSAQSAAEITVGMVRIM